MGHLHCRTILFMHFNPSNLVQHLNINTAEKPHIPPVSQQNTNELNKKFQYTSK